jgi:hypothetical protein
MRPLFPAAVLAGLAFLLAACEVRIDRPGPEITPDATAPAFARWPAFPVSYCIDLSREGFVENRVFVAHVQRAFDEWGVEAEFDGECSEPVEDGNNQNQIGWGTVELLGGGNGGVYEAGVTRMRTRTSPTARDEQPARLVEANIFIDPMPPRQFRTPECLFTTILHEVGHFLGIGHLPAPAVMAAVNTACPQELTAADREALAELYQNRR